MGTLGERSSSTPMVVSDVDRDVLRNCAVGTRFKLWTKPDLEYVNAYVPGGLGGAGLAFQLTKADNPKIAAQMARRLPAWVVLSAIEGGRYKLEAFATSQADIDAERRDAVGELVQTCRKPYAPRKAITGVALRANDAAPPAAGAVYECVPKPVEAFCAQLPVSVDFVCEGQPALTLASSTTVAVQIVRAVLSGYHVTAKLDWAATTTTQNRDWETLEFFYQYKALATVEFTKD